MRCWCRCLMLPHANINTKIPLLSLWMPRTLSDSERWLQCLNNCEWHFRFISLSLEQHHRTLPIENFSLYIYVIRLSKIVFFIFTSTIKTGILLYLRLTETWRERERNKKASLHHHQHLHHLLTVDSTSNREIRSSIFTLFTIYKPIIKSNKSPSRI